MKRKVVGYIISSKLKCKKVFEKINKKGKKVRVTYDGKKLRKGIKVFKKKTDCEKRIRKLKEKKLKLKRKAKAKAKAKPKAKAKAKKTKKVKYSRFGQAKCHYETPFFGQAVPSVGKHWSGTPSTGISSSAWMWPSPPGSLAFDTQVGGWNKY